MGGFITLDDGRALAPNNWSYDTMIRAIIAEIPSDTQSQTFAAWLGEQTNEALGSGMGLIDVRELTPENRCRFRTAAENAIARCERDGPVGWHERNISFFPEWLRGFRKLRDMWQSLDRGEPPDALTDLTSPIPPTGDRSGPGWGIA